METSQNQRFAWLSSGSKQASCSPQLSGWQEGTTREAIYLWQQASSSCFQLRGVRYPPLATSGRVVRVRTCGALLSKLPNWMVDALTISTCTPVAFAPKEGHLGLGSRRTCDCMVSSLTLFVLEDSVYLLTWLWQDGEFGVEKHPIPVVASDIAIGAGAVTCILEWWYM
ncbi:expressed unknown protein [Seminavis robusta]|uniref:Uncharacterized protein n=1 Tax=Seminavis robusta TaxID=568900 RepID=A0A9N8EG61_9STRA|nr:expressed unknown protein [Seminavis robusta]|eukprot:Sro888_g216471.1  (169) ;mRNA; r:30148-30654